MEDALKHSEEMWKNEEIDDSNRYLKKAITLLEFIVQQKPGSPFERKLEELKKRFEERKNATAVEVSAGGGSSGGGKGKG